MASKENPGKIPERKLPEFKITKEETQKMKTMSAILDMLSKDPDLMKRIVQEYMKASTAPREQSLIAGMEVKETVSTMIADKLKEIPRDQIDAYFPDWSRIIWYIHKPIWIPRIQADQGPEFERGF